MDIKTVNEILTKREREVFMLILTNTGMPEIASQLEITPRAVRFHLSQILKKTNCKTRLELVSNFIDPLKPEKNIMKYIFELQKEISNLKSRLDLMLPRGLDDNG